MNKDKIINDLLSRISKLEWEVEDLEKENKVLKQIIPEIHIQPKISSPK